MSMFVQPSLYLLLSLLAAILHSSNGDIGTVALYSPPYLPTACYGNSPSQFPSNNLFAAAGEGIWDNGAACGRQYLVRCISAAVPRTCLPNQIIQVRIVDRAQTAKSRPSADGATLYLSPNAFGTVADPSATLINAEFRQV